MNNQLEGYYEGNYDKFTNEQSYSFTFLSKSDTDGSIHVSFSIKTCSKVIKQISLDIYSTNYYRSGYFDYKFQKDPKVIFISEEKNIITISEVLKYSSDGNPSTSSSITESLSFHIDEIFIKKLTESNQVEYSIRGNCIVSQGTIKTNNLLHFYNIVLDKIKSLK
jgi:hypothetical protein